MSEQLSYVLFASGTAAVLLALAARATAAIASRLVMRAPLAAAFPGGVATLDADRLDGMAGYGRYLSLLGTVLLVASIASRGLVAGRYPLSNMYDFSIALAMGMLVALHLVEARYRLAGIGLVLTPVASALLVYAAALSPAIKPLVPALQAPELLTLHVSMALVAYSAFAIGFGGAVLHLLQQRLASEYLPSLERSDEVGYLGAALGFPFMTLVLTFGAYWANEAWGRHWGWDPKESAALATWLIYAAYLHLHPHRRAQSQWLLVIGYAAVLLTYFGNLFLRGLHAYA